MNNIKLLFKFFIISVAFFATDICISQEYNFSELEKLTKSGRYLEVISIIEQSDDSFLTTYDKAFKQLIIAECYYRLEVKDIGFEKALEAKEKFQKLNSTNKIIDCNHLIIKILASQNDTLNNKARHKLIKDTDDLLLKNNNYWEGFAENHRAKGALLFTEREPTIEEVTLEFKKIIPYASKTNDSIMIAYAYQNISYCLEEYQYIYETNVKSDSILYLAQEAERLYIKYGEISALSHNYNNRALTYRDIENYQMALKYLFKADSLNIKKNSLSTKALIYNNISAIYDSIRDYKNSLNFLRKSIKLKDSLKEIQQGIRIKETEERFNNVKLKAKNLKTSTQLYGSLLLIIVLIIIGYFIIKTSHRKRFMALQEKELETQKNLTLLKEQEITTINAMVEGQEKERKRVAEDLHDNLGSVIATLKLHFDNLRINREKKKIDQETLFDQTETLIDDAYKKVRSIAHAKNAGVIANQGLLAAVSLMAEKISSANKLEIQVVHSGLDAPLDNSLEISLFRIIQELVTNVIKHAEASYVTIGLNEHQDGINIMIEDDGKGMKVSQIDLKKGMGLHSIQTRIEHLKGDFTIDSTPTKGTTIIINVPT